MGWGTRANGLAPCEGALDDQMQVPERAVAGHLRAAADQRLDVLELNADLEDGLARRRAFTHFAGCGHQGLSRICPRFVPKGIGAPGGIRTPDQWLRKPLLYPAELQARFARTFSTPVPTL
jgi:hypothetical protein